MLLHVLMLGSLGIYMVYELTIVIFCFKTYLCRAPLRPKENNNFPPESKQILVVLKKSDQAVYLKR